MIRRRNESIAVTQSRKAEMTSAVGGGGGGGGVRGAGSRIASAPVATQTPNRSDVQRSHAAHNPSPPCAPAHDKKVTQSPTLTIATSMNSTQLAVDDSLTPMTGQSDPVDSSGLDPSSPSLGSELVGDMVAADRSPHPLAEDDLLDDFFKFVSKGNSTSLFPFFKFPFLNLLLLLLIFLYFI